ncbi:hypothetical protein EAH79_04880 [Sphingomonas koreensis]|nr:hypothetical protein EAH79_04880 [Sphingomonas koreensis]
MSSYKRASQILLTGVAFTALSACNGANDVASPGSGGDITINNPAPTPSPSPTPTPSPTSALITPASGCPTIADSQGLTEGDGTTRTITGPTGEYLICTLPTRIKASVTLPYIKGIVYRLGGRVDVGTDGGPTASASDTNVTLTIDPGVIVYGGTGVSWLAVNRGNKLHAVGTVEKPIIFTSRDNILGLNTENSSGQWGGVVLLGRGQVTDCQDPAATPGTTACERQTEGAVDPALYGGNSNDDNSGDLEYIQIRYSGYVLSANSELQSLTPSGVGTGTVMDHFLSVNSSDDGAEFFGGHPRMKHYISVGAEDDNIDSDTGTKARFQYVLVAQRPNIGDAIIEADTDNTTSANTPRQYTQVVNFTFLDRSPNASSDLASILLRGQTDYALINGILVSPNNPCIRMSDPQTVAAKGSAADENGPPVFRSMVMQCGSTKYVGSTTNGTVTADQVEAIFGSGSNNNDDAFTPSLVSDYIDGANELAVTPTDPTSFDSYFDKTTYIGAVKDGNDTWYQGWTCNSNAADFGSGNSGACSSLPVYSD